MVTKPPEPTRPDPAPPEMTLSQINEKAQALGDSQFEKDNERITEQQAIQIVKHLGACDELTPQESLAAIYRLFLKGAANKGTPNSLSVTITTKDGLDKRISKQDLLMSYKKVTGNLFLRRMAEFLATHISEYAEKHQLDGDLVSSISSILKEDEEPLNMVERAWASSFNQNNKKLMEKSNRLEKLLSRDKNIRFPKKPIPKGSSPRKPGPSKRKGARKTDKTNSPKLFASDERST